MTPRRPQRRTERSTRQGSHRQGACHGLTLVELLLGLTLGLTLFVTFLQAVLLQGRGNERLVRQIRERDVQRRTLALLRSELLRADRIELGGSQVLRPACSLTGRRPVLQLQIPQGTISYSIGGPPSAIWRGQVLMRCGPAYDLNGEPSRGASQNRVLLDGLTGNGFEANRSAPGRLRLGLRQQFRLLDGSRQEISSGLELATAESSP